MTQKFWKTVWETPAYYRMARSNIRTMERFLPLAIEPTTRFQLFTTAAAKFEWRSSTQHTYWCMVLNMLEIVGSPITRADRRDQRFLEAKMNEEIPNQSDALTPEIIRQMWEEEPNTEETILITLAFVLGQRLPDIALLENSNLFVIRPPQMPPYVAIQILRGKVIRFVKPYTLALATAHWFTAALWEWKKARTVPSMFSPCAVQKASAMLRTYGVRSGGRFDVRSVRRGGLTQMALRGWPLQTILVFSKHQHEGMLRKYLQHGAMLAHEAHQKIQVTNDLLQQCTKDKDWKDL